MEYGNRFRAGKLPDLNRVTIVSAGENGFRVASEFGADHFVLSLKVSLGLER